MTEPAPPSERFELAKFGARLVLGRRGDVLAEFLDERRNRRHVERFGCLVESLRASGLDEDALAELVEESDEASELFEEVVGSAAKSRYDAKIKYLGQVLSAGLLGDDSMLDAAFLRVRAVNDIEKLHVVLLALVEECRDIHGTAVPFRLRQTAQDRGLDLESIRFGFDLLTQHGLVVENLAVELELDLDEVGVAVDGSAEPYADWALTASGAELLNALRESIEGG